MAEYIDREEVLKLQADYGESQYIMMLIDPKLVKKLPAADVVERAEYDKLKHNLEQRIEVQKQNLARVMEYSENLEQENKELSSKVVKIDSASR